MSIVQKFLHRLLRVEKADTHTHSRPLHDAVLAAERLDAPLAIKPLYEIFDESAKRYGDRPCIEFMGRTYTYGQVATLIDRAAEGFRRLGVGTDTRVGLCLPNTPFFVICYYAILKAGGTVVNVNPLYVEREIAHLIADSGMRIMVTLDVKSLFSRCAPLLGLADLETLVVCRLRSALPTLKGLLFSLLKSDDVSRIPDDPRYVSFRSLLDNDGIEQVPDINPQSHIALLQYTGGTTGIPKGAMLSHANLSANTEQVRRLYPDLEDGKERILTVIPLFHAFSMTVAMNLGIAAGAELILLARFDMVEVLKAIEDKRPTLMPGVPALFAALAENPDAKDSDLSSIKACISGGAPLPLAIKLKFEALSGCKIVEGYGLSEASPVVTCNPFDSEGKEGSIGLALPHTAIGIRDTEPPHACLAEGEIGEICVSGPQVMLGYWNQPEQTAQVIRDRVLHTGDIGYIDPDSYVFLIDRQKDIIINGGFNVYPRIIEDVIHLYPDVIEVAVIGVPHAQQGEVPKAFVTLREGAEADLDALHVFLHDKLSPMEMPRDIEFRDALPKTLVGKLSKQDLLSEELARRSQHQVTQPKTTSTTVA